MSNQKMNSPIPPAAQLVLDFFDNELAEVKFPDVDRALLQEAADRVFSLAEEQARAEAALQAARDALQEGQEQLLYRCQRALAYGRIYAEEDPDLLRRLEAVSIPRNGKGKVPAAPAAGPPNGESKLGGRRGRRPAAAPSNGSALFAEAAQDDLPI